MESIKPTDLQFNDWYTALNPHGERCAYQCELNDYIDQEGFEYSEPEPMPLTPEMMSLNGFKYVEVDPLSRYYTYEGLFILIIIQEGCQGGFSGSWTGSDPYGRPQPRYGVYMCQSVHQLQQFLRVAGLRELADNFRVS